MTNFSIFHSLMFLMEMSALSSYPLLCQSSAKRSDFYIEPALPPTPPGKCANPSKIWAYIERIQQTPGKTLEKIHYNQSPTKSKLQLSKTSIPIAIGSFFCLMLFFRYYAFLSRKPGKLKCLYHKPITSQDPLKQSSPSLPASI